MKLLDAWREIKGTSLLVIGAMLYFAGRVLDWIAANAELSTDLQVTVAVGLMSYVLGALSTVVTTRMSDAKPAVPLDALELLLRERDEADVRRVEQRARE